MRNALNIFSKVASSIIRTVRNEYAIAKHSRFLRRSGLFDKDWYLREYPDVKASNSDPLKHYLKIGALEGRNPHPLFDTNWYLAQYPDVAHGGVNPLLHYLKFGIFEGRKPNNPELLLQNVKIAVVFHFFYKDLWAETVEWLGNIPMPFDLYISIPKDRAAELRVLITKSYPDATILEVDNAGRDIGSFISMLPLLAGKNYTAICKIHTKKGQTEPAVWRNLMLRGLLGSKFLITRILLGFQTDPDLFLVGPADLYVSGPTLIMDNLPTIEKLVVQVYPGRPMPVEWGFFAGTMFWISPRALDKLMRLSNKRVTFETEDGRNDGQTAHAIERLFGLLATLEGGHVGLTEIRGPGPWDSSVAITPAPGKPAQQDVSIILQKHTKKRRDIRPLVRRSPLRQWVPPAEGCCGVNFIGPVEFINGVSISARGYVSCLMEAKIPVNVIPWQAGFDRLRKIHIEYPAGSMQPINIIHLNLDLLTIAKLLDTRPLNEIVNPGCYNIAIIYWELASLPAEWSDTIHRFDEIWCASSFIARSVAAVSMRPVRIVRPTLGQKRMTGQKTRNSFGLPMDRFVFFYAADAGSILARKNPKALVEAYVEEFKPEEGACCLIKIHYSDSGSQEIQDILALAKERPDVIFMDCFLEDADMQDLFDAIDCYVSPHRSEGLGLTILEAMYAGKPVIATPYGGAADFVKQESAWPLEYRLIEIEEGNDPYPPNYLWADPLPGSLRQGMRELFSNRGLASELGKKGQEYVREMFSPLHTAQVIRDEIDRIWSRGNNMESITAMKPFPGHPQD